MDGKYGYDGVLRETTSRQHHVQKSPIESSSKRRKILCFGATAVLACLVLGLASRWVYHAFSCEGALTTVPKFVKLNIPSGTRAVTGSSLTPINLQQFPTTTSPTRIIQHRDGSGFEASSSSDTNESLITDSDGTWVIVSSDEATDSQGSPSTQAARTTTETESLTDHVIISYATETKLSTLTVTSTASLSTTSTTENSPSSRSTTKSTLTTLQSISPTPITTVIPTLLSSCPYLTCASTCPWTTCTTHPTTMDTALCQMLDPCFFNHKGYLPAPPSQGGKCACLCESGWCTNPVKKKGKLRKLSCAEWDCCHECECFADDLMAEQRGNGRC